MTEWIQTVIMVSYVGVDTPRKRVAPIRYFLTNDRL